MKKIDLVTGFLGSGKTTFIRKYAGYLMDKGYKVGILENDFGAVNVDMMLLQDLVGDKCDLEMVAGGCDADCHKRRFKTKLIALRMQDFDRIIVEPSGIFDLDEFFDTLREAPLDRWYQIGSVISVVDAGLEDDLSKQAEYVLASETAYAGMIVLSKTGSVSEDKIADTIAHLNRSLENVKCKRKISSEVIRKVWTEFTDEDFQDIMDSGYKSESFEKLDFDQRDIFNTVYLMNYKFTEESLCQTVKNIMQDTACGNVLRIKGFAQLEKDKWTELNATKQNISVKPIEKGQEVLIVIGENLDEEKIKYYAENVT